MLARQGTKPQVAREIMRHSDYKTTLAHYTMLGLNDTAGAINELPDIGVPETTRATGTMDATADPPQIPQQSVHETVQFSATASEQARIINGCPEDSNQLEYAELSNDMQRYAKKRASGFEPPTSSLGSWHSTTELRPQMVY